MDITFAEWAHFPEIIQISEATHVDHMHLHPGVFPPTAPGVLNADIDNQFELDWHLKRHPAKTIFVCLQDTELLGYVFFKKGKTRQFPNCLYIHDIGVKEATRRNGVGSALLSKLTDYAQEIGVGDIFADVWSGNAASQQLFRTNGYRVIESIKYAANKKPMRSVFRLDVRNFQRTPP